METVALQTNGDRAEREKTLRWKRKHTVASEARSTDITYTTLATTALFNLTNIKHLYHSASD